MFVLRLTKDGITKYLKCDRYGTFESMRLVPNPWEATVCEQRSTCMEFKERAEGFLRCKGEVISTKEVAQSVPYPKISA